MKTFTLTEGTSGLCIKSRGLDLLQFPGMRLLELAGRESPVVSRSSREVEDQQDEEIQQEEEMQQGERQQPLAVDADQQLAGVKSC